MRPERWQRIKALFQEALELPPRDAAAAVERACGGDAELCREVDRLLALNASAVARLRNPGIVTVFDLGVAPEAGVYIVMELLEGETLREALGRDRLEL